MFAEHDFYQLSCLWFVCFTLHSTQASLKLDFLKQVIVYRDGLRNKIWVNT